MSILTLVVILGAVLFAIGFAAQKLAEFVRGDGATERGRAHTGPRSHHLDQFDPRSRTA